MSILNRLSLKQRLVMVGLLPAALLATCITALVLWRGTNAMDIALSDRGVAIVSFLAPASEYAIISGNRDTQSSLLQAVLEQTDVIGAALYNRDGALLAVSGRLSLADNESIAATRIPTRVASGQARLGFSAPVVSAPLILDDVFDMQTRQGSGHDTTIIGWVYVELSGDAVLQRKRDIITLILSLFFAGLGIAGLVASRLAAGVGKPLAALVVAVRRIGDGELNVAVPTDAGSDEIRELQRGFNSMAQSIASSHHELQARIDEATAKLAFQAMHDPLTGLPNRRAFELALEDAVEHSRRAGDEGTLCFIDLDRFKIVNDTCGHAAGDELLQQIASLIVSRVRSGDLISRIGGDEFALILHDCSTEAARVVAESMREAVAALRFDWEGRTFTVGASIGLARIDGRRFAASDLLVAADMACYSAKRAGRNQVVEHVEEPSSTPTATALPQTLGVPQLPYQQFVLFQQRIQSCDGENSNPWVEVLLRLRDEDGSLRSPVEMLSRFAMDEAMLNLDLWIARNACHTVASKPGLGRFSLNLSAYTVIHGKRYWPQLLEYLGSGGIVTERLVLEFPARLAEQWPDECNQFIASARRYGMKIALERLDGSSTTLLPALKPDFIKVSMKSLVETFGMEAGCNLAQALCGMALALDIPRIASEIEDPSLLDRLSGYGFDYLQGDLVSATLPLDHDPVFGDAG